MILSDEKCPKCGGLIKIRNSTGKCDHLYYPDNVHISLSNKINTTGGTNLRNTRVIKVENVKTTIKNLKEIAKVIACLNPNVQYCNECAICKAIEDQFNKEVGDKLI